MGNYIGVKRMRAQGLTGFPEKIPTHVYIWFTHFFELSKLLDDMIKFEALHPGTAKKWIKFVQCQWEREMYERVPVHSDIYSKDCSRCRSYVEELVDKAIWWFNVGTDKFVRMTYKFCNDNTTFECSSMWVKIVGMFEVELKIEDSSEGVRLRRSFRVVCNE